jgi:hypothetical protein
MKHPFKLGQQRTDAAKSLIAAGLIEALIVAYCCQLPRASSLTLRTLVFTALKYVAMSTLAAGVGAWTFHNLRKSQSPLSYRVLVILGGPSWVMITPIVLFFRQDSAWTLLGVSIASALTAVCIRNLLPGEDLVTAAVPTYVHTEKPLLYWPPAEPAPKPWRAIFLSVGLYGTAVMLFTGRLFTACLLAAASVFVMAWQFFSSSPRLLSASTLRKQLASVAVIAFLLTCIALFPWLKQQKLDIAGKSMEHLRTVSASERQPQSTLTGAGYQGVILWTLPQKKESLPPTPNVFSPQSGESAKPFVIPFDGAYWYFQAPNLSPGSQAHEAHGDPLMVNIHSSNFLPLLMEVHQQIASSMALSCCSELRMDIKNGDSHLRNVHFAVVLTDSLTPGRPSQYLGEQPVLSSQAAHTFPVDETLTFPIPTHSLIQKFDQITVIVMPSETWSENGAKIAIRQFAFMPR